MIKTGLLNPHVLSLLARVRHTNTLVIADRGFPFWPQLETVDLSLVDDVPTVPQVVQAVRANFQISRAYAAEESRTLGDLSRLVRALPEVPLTLEPHAVFKRRVPLAIGLIRTGDATPFANVILESG